MAENKKGFVLYADQIEIFEQLPDDVAGRLIKHIYNYVNDKNPSTEDLIIKIAFAPIKSQLKRDLVKYEQRREKNRENANKRWNATACDGIKSDAKHAVIVNDTVNDIDKDKDINIEFDVFWNLYDKKIGMIKCQSKWNKLTNNEREQIIEYIPKYKFAFSDKKFRKNPETFLNNKSWNDELIQKNVSLHSINTDIQSNPNRLKWQ